MRGEERMTPKSQCVGGKAERRMIGVYIRMGFFVLIAAVSLRYGLFVRSGGAGNTFYRFWYVLGALNLFFAAGVYFDLWSKLPKFVRTLIFILCMLGIILIIGLIELIGGMAMQTPKRADYLIVLGAQVREDGPSTVLRYRLDTAVTYLNDNPDTVCIVSGGKGDNEPCSEAEAMRKYLTEHGIAGERILLEDQSGNTAENLKNCLAMLPSPDVSVAVLTNNFHMCRAIGIARKAGYKKLFGVPAPSTKAYLVHNVTREMVGIVKDFVMGNLAIK